ncbi:hypothetical protein SAMN05428977_10711, partial [Nitrosomonas sp. Nm166]
MSDVTCFGKELVAQGFEGVLDIRLAGNDI